MRKKWMLAGAPVVVAVAVIGGAVAMSSASQATPASQRPPANTAKVEKGNLSAVVFLYGTLTHRARVGRLAVRRDQPGRRDIHEAARRRRRRSAAATCSIGWTAARCCCCAARRRRTGRCQRAIAAPTSSSSTPNLMRLGYADALPARPGLRILRLRDGLRPREAAVQAGPGSDRVAEARPSGVPARPVRIATGDRRASGSIARPGAPVAQATSTSRRGPGGARRLAAGERHGRRPGPDHAARQQHHARNGHSNRDGRDSSGSGSGRRAPARAVEPRRSRSTSRSSTPGRPALSSRRRCRSRSPPRGSRMR